MLACNSFDNLKYVLLRDEEIAMNWIKYTNITTDEEGLLKFR